MRRRVVLKLVGAAGVYPLLADRDEDCANAHIQAVSQIMPVAIPDSAQEAAKLMWFEDDTLFGRQLFIITYMKQPIYYNKTLGKMCYERRPKNPHNNRPGLDDNGTEASLR